MRTLEIHLDEWLGTERANNDSAGNAFQGLRIDPLPARHLPHQAVIEAQLLDLAVANPVGPAVAHVAYPSAFGADQQGCGGSTHAAELRVLLPLGMNTRI